MVIGREVKLLVGSLVLLALAAVLVIQYTDVCRLQAVTLNGQPVSQWSQKFGLRPDLTVIRQPVDSLANSLLLQQGITRVDIQYRLPNMLNISTNRLDPICYLIDRVTGTFFGLDESGRVVPVDLAQSKWDMPIFTGLRVRRLHDYTDDYRANLVIPQLLQIRQNEPSLYQSIEEVDFSRPSYVGIGFSGRNFRLRVPADQLTERFNEFNDFVLRYQPPLDSTSCFDLTYDDEIIRIGATLPKKAPVIDSSIMNDKSDFSEDPELMPPTTLEISSKEKSPDVDAPLSQGPGLSRTEPAKPALNKVVRKDIDARTLAGEHISSGLKSNKISGSTAKAGQAAKKNPSTTSLVPQKPSNAPSGASAKAKTAGAAARPKATIHKKPAGKKTTIPGAPHQ